MYTRHDEVPVYEYRSAQVDASHYNHAQVALKRLKREIRLEIPGLRTLDLILLKDAWVIVDRAYNDLPVAAWTEFEAKGRDALHAPVRCRIRIFHACAGVILKRVLAAMVVLLGERLGGNRGGVIPFDRNH